MTRGFGLKVVAFYKTVDVQMTFARYTQISCFHKLD